MLKTIRCTVNGKARELSFDVRASLLAQGAGGQQVKIKSLGETRPKVVGHDEASWSENRRADVVYEVEN